MTLLPERTRPLRAVLLAALCVPAAATQAQVNWQQRVDHAISVRLDDRSHLLRGVATFTYHNNSPLALDTIWVHLWPNAYSDRSTALCRQLVDGGDLDLHFAKEEDRGRIDSIAFIATRGAHDSRAEQLTWGYHPRHTDIAWLKLERSLGSGERIKITTPFRVKVPDGRFSRLGHTGQAYYITQWYPKPAVFDAQGWHAMPYLTQGEFFSEFGRFEVDITLPRNYVVGATGVLQDEEERAWMDQLAGRPVPPAPARGTGSAIPASDSTWKTIRFVQDSVHDFAWFADKRFVVRKGEVTLRRSGRTVTTWTLFTPQNADLWSDAVTYVNEGLAHYSNWVGDYPYPACTAVDGTISAGGGMEYPMITVIGNMNNRESLDEVIAHEVGHNWFQGILASNERDHPWMDEGMNSFVELRYMRARYPNSRPSMGLPGDGLLIGEVADPHRFRSEMAYLLNARRDLDQPIELHADGYSQMNYGGIVYGKTALVFDQLLAYLGEETFDRCMHAYFNEWRFRHPAPADVRRVFEQESGRELGWMFDGLMATNAKVDVKARRLKGRELRYTMRGGVDMPFPLSDPDDPAKGSLWVMPDSTRRTTLPWDARRVRIDAAGRTLDIDRRNNAVRAHGLFRRCTPQRFAPLFGIGASERRTTRVSPALGWNAHDGVMAGIALHNITVPAQRVEWAVAPLYGTRSSRPVGGARLFWNHDRLAGGPIGNIHAGITAQSASLFAEEPLERWYLRVSPQLDIDMRSDPRRRRSEHRVGYRAVVLRESLGGILGDTLEVERVREDIYHELSYAVKGRSALRPAALKLDLQHHEAFTRLALEARQAFVYDKRKHRIAFRLFAGQFLRKEDALMQRQMGWRLHWGSSDMTFDHLFMDRQDVGTNTAQQMAKDQGAFRVPTAQGTSDTWIAALNMEADMPFRLPLSVYASAGAAPYTLVGPGGRSEKWRMHAEAGIGIRIVRDLAEVWIPLVFTKEIANELELRDVDPLERIRFVLALEKLDPARLFRGLRP